METIRAHGKFHAAHRQLDYDGKCAYVHGHTWRGVFVVSAARFPRLEKLDMSVDFGALKDIFKFLDRTQNQVWGTGRASRAILSAHSQNVFEMAATPRK